VESKERRRIGPVEGQGSLTAFEAAPGRWHLLVETQGESTVDMRELAAPTVPKRCSLVELAADGAITKELAPDLPGCKVVLPPASGLRLFGVQMTF
jgi:hypothetical protein